MNLYVMVAGKTWKASSAELLKLMGFTEGRAPIMGCSPVMIQGIKVWVTPLNLDRDRRSKKKPHRVMAECPKCGEVVSAGRLRQHSEVHNKCERCGGIRTWAGASCGCFDNGSE